MIRRHGTLLRLSLAGADAAAAIGLVTVMSQLRFGPDWAAAWTTFFTQPWVPAVLVALGWVVVLWTQGLYRLRQRWSFRGHVGAMVRALAVMILITFAGLFLFKLEDVSRLFLLAVLPSLAVASLALRGLIYAWLASAWLSGRNLRNILIVGSGATALGFARELEDHPALGLRIVGYVSERTPDSDHGGWRRLGSIEGLADVFHAYVIDEVAICLDLASWEMIEQITVLCQAEGKVVRIPLAGTMLTRGTAHVESLAHIPILSIFQGPDQELALAFKRLIDIGTATAGLIATIPVALAVSVAILLEDGRPILFRQERVGLHGRRFKVVKFRTMRSGAEHLQGELLALNEVKGQAFKITNDPRVTRVGRFLRRTSLDELPQLWNVLAGEMSLVGPRPPLPAEVDEYDIWHRRRLSMKPGITGLWQVEARRESDFDRWVQKDLEYIDRWSLWLDAKIALRTLPAILRLEGR